MKIQYSSKIQFSILCACILHATLAYGQTSKTLEELVTKLNSTTHSLTGLEKVLLDFNIRRAYSYDENIQPSAIIWNPTKAKFQTHYFIPNNSSLLQMSSKKQLEHFEVEVNGIRLNILSVFVPEKVKSSEFWAEIGKLLEVDFNTIEDGQLYIIGRFINGQTTLVREKVPTPQSLLPDKKPKK